MRRPIVKAAMLTLLVLVSFASDATVDGINLHWTSKGSGPQTVVFAHGWTRDDTSWRRQVPGISQKYRVNTLDLPGHRKSGSPNAILITFLAKLKL
jgi:pimeloyl-ACP methyl ester carboxylesterase